MGIGGDLTGQLEQLLVVSSLRKRALFRMIGPASQSARAEGEIQRMYPGTRALLLPSATVGLALLLELLGIETGREVLIAPLGWLSNWSCLHRAGLVPRFVPLDGRLQMTAEAVERRLGDRTGAVIVTHMLGRGQQEVAAIAALCASRGVPLLEDIAQAFGVSVNGRRTGTFGAAAWCSLNHHKIVSTGDGGFVLVRDESLFASLCARHDQGCVMSDGKRRAPAAPEPGLSLRVNELTAAVLRAQVARYHLVRARILTLHAAMAAACADGLEADVIAPNAGDLPFTVIFRRPRAMRYPSLLDAGWHVASNVPWLADRFAAAERADPALSETMGALRDLSMLGSGFLDPYYAVPLGLAISDLPDRASSVIKMMERAS